VQGELEAALERILGTPAGLTVAGRTDAGVHAWAQVASFDGPDDPPDELVRRLNSILPRSIAVVDVARADGFDARRDARSRVYCYWVLASAVRNPFHEGRALWWPHPLDRAALEACAAALPGTHDFTAFTPTRTEHVRFERNVVGAEWRAHALADPFPGELLEFWIECDAFMRHMVRVLLGTMLEVGDGRRSVDDFRSLLEGVPRERAGETAPAHGLHLAAVRY
jgi:tRNA pseudouridine38-40 synthase